ncbi:MAG: PIN domain-containing protein [Acidobacteria bacterium]|nr:PIN domain-containing protein [Acidobacteriota bacterium]
MRMLVLDANILIRAVLGSRALLLLRKYSERANFVTPDTAFQEARDHLPKILERQKIREVAAYEIFELLPNLIQTIDTETYAQFEAEARALIERRDVNDWPILATALALNCPIWTEDTDFFGCGVPTWTTDRVEHYLAKIAPSS